MINTESSIFHGKLVRLAAPDLDDLETIASWQDHSVFMRFADTDPIKPVTADRLREFWAGMADGRNSTLFHVRTIASDKLIGTVGLFEIRWNNGTGVLGVGIGEQEYWGGGYGTEACKLVIDYGFNELNLHRIELNVTDYNSRAIRAYEKLGFVHEGTRRQAGKRDGQRYDILDFGLLVDEWKR